MTEYRNETIQDADDSGRRRDNPDRIDTTGERVAAEAVGGVAGAASGAALGSLVGPVGLFIGALAGTVGGWWSGKAVGDDAGEFDARDEHYRTRFRETSGDASQPYENVRPAYQVGHLAARNPDYTGRSFDEIEPELKRGWSSDLARDHGDWDTARKYASDAYYQNDRGRRDQ